jgi:hypothetical protein
MSLVLDDLNLAFCRRPSWSGASPPLIPRAVTALRFADAHDDRSRDAILAFHAHSLEDLAGVGIDPCPVRLGDERPPGTFAYVISTDRGFYTFPLAGRRFA